MEAKVYCDNEALRNLIINSMPNKAGLYPHELAMIFYCSIGQIECNTPRFPSVFFYQLRVNYPVYLLYSLIDRGYIRKSAFSENIRFYKTREMQSFVKKYGLKSSNRRDVLTEVIMSNFEESTIREVFPQDYFVPTEKGQNALDVTDFSILDAYKGWNNNCGLANDFSLTPEDIPIFNPSIDGISVCTTQDEWKYSLTSGKYSFSIQSRIFELPNRSDITISINGQAKCKLVDIDIIRLLHRKKVLILESIIDQQGISGRREVYSTGFDLVNEKVVFHEYIDDHMVEHNPVSLVQFVEQHTEKSNAVITHGGFINYYASVNDEICYIFLKKYLEEKNKLIQVRDIKPFFEGNSSRNIVITVSDTNYDLRNIIHFLINQRLLSQLAINGVPVYQIAYCLYLEESITHAGSKTRAYLLEEDSSTYADAEFLLSNLTHSGTEYKQFSTEFWVLPSNLYFMDAYRHYDTKNPYQNDSNWKFAISNEPTLRNKYNQCLLDMKETGLIPTRWVNEISLYFLIRNYLPDAIYQYRCDWLGLQSLDIFIPSKKTGIEYQGRQHYEAVDYFGGEQALVETQKRDAHKRSLCKENNIRLLTWEYTVRVTPENVSRFLSCSGLFDDKGQ